MPAETADHKRDLDWLLKQFINRVPGTLAAIVAANDGLRTITCNLGQDDADRLAALASGLFSLGKGVGKLVGVEDGGIRQVVVEHDSALLFISAAGQGSVLAVLAEPDVNVGNAGYEMSLLVKSVMPYLSTAVRQPPISAGSSVR